MTPRLVMRSDDPRCQDLLETVVDGKKWASIHPLLEWAYRLNDGSRHARAIILGSLPVGEGGDGFLALAIVTRLHRVLGFDHLIQTVHVLYGEDPEATFSLVESLMKSSGCSRGSAFLDIENYCISRRPSSVRPSRGELILSGWHAMAVDVLEMDFRSQGWLE